MWYIDWFWNVISTVVSASEKDTAVERGSGLANNSAGGKYRKGKTDIAPIKFSIEKPQVILYDSASSNSKKTPSDDKDYRDMGDSSGRDYKDRGDSSGRNYRDRGDSSRYPSCKSSVPLLRAPDKVTPLLETPVATKPGPLLQTPPKKVPLLEPPPKLTLFDAPPARTTLLADPAPQDTRRILLEDPGTRPDFRNTSGLIWIYLYINVWCK